MQFVFKFTLSLSLFLLVVSSCTIKDNETVNSSQYSENSGAQIFKPGIISTGMHEHSSPIFSPNDDIILWTISLSGQKVILQLGINTESEQKPKVTAFSGQYRDEYPFFSPDGNTIYFMSWRPDSIGQEPNKTFRHWKVEKNGKQWSIPELNNSFHPDMWTYSMSKHGKVFGWAKLENNKKDADIYYQDKSGDSYSEPVNLGDSINSDAIEYCPFISHDGEILVFGRMGTGEYDGLYFSKKDTNGVWSHAKKLPELVNLNRSERFPTISIDNRHLYFNRQDRVYTPFSSKRLDYEDIKEKYLNDPANGNIYFINLDNIIVE